MRLPSVTVRWRHREERPFALSVETVSPADICFRSHRTCNLRGQPALVCSAFFEGLFVLLNTAPKMSRLPAVRAVLPFFAELFDRTNRYYCPVLDDDTYCLPDRADCGASSTVDQICQRSGSCRVKTSDTLHTCPTMAALTLRAQARQRFDRNAQPNFPHPSCRPLSGVGHLPPEGQRPDVQPVSQPSRIDATPPINSIVSDVVLANPIAKKNCFPFANRLLDTLEAHARLEIGWRRAMRSSQTSAQFESFRPIFAQRGAAQCRLSLAFEH
jgi:hypothetical protein